MADARTTEGRIDAFNKQFDLIKSGLTNTVGQHEKMGKKATKLKDNIEGSIKLEPFGELETALAAVRDALAEIEREREKAITTRMQGSVLGKLNAMDTDLKKPMNFAAKELASKKKKLEKETKKTTINETAVQDARKGLADSEVAFYQTLPKFEEGRVEDTKALLMEYCNSMLYFHCKSIEQLSNAMRTLGKVDSSKAKKAMEKVIKKEGIKTKR